MNNLISYTFKTTPIRTIIIAGTPWFVATDVAKALDYVDSAHAIRGLDDDERGLLNSETPGKELAIINESGLYSLILRSRKPEAKAFKKFVTSEVLPSIRKTGAYAANNAPRREDWEIDDKDLIYFLNRWHATKNKKDTLEFRRLNSEIEELSRKLAAIKKEIQ